MKKVAWLSVIPAVILVLGLTGRSQLPGELSVSDPVTYRDLAALSNRLLSGVTVQMHEPFASPSLPAEKKKNLTGALKDENYIPGLAQSDMTLPGGGAEMEDASIFGDESTPGRKKKAKGMFGARTGPDFGDRVTGASLAPERSSDNNGGWGKGWMAETIFKEETASRTDAGREDRMPEPDSLSIDRMGAGRSGGGAQDGNDRSDRVDNGGRLERFTPDKASIKFDTWKSGRGK